MREIKYLSIGLFIGISATALLLTVMFIPSAVSATLPTDTVTPASTPTLIVSTTTYQLSPTSSLPTETFTPTPTFIQPTGTPTTTDTPTVTPTVPSPTPTLSAALMALLESGHLSQNGPMSLEQQFNVYGASLKFIRKTNAESRQVGDLINGQGYGSPSDICGPLSISILQDAGIIRSDLSPHAFWLLNPDLWDDRHLLGKAFPASQFENIQFNRKLNSVDWNETPLYPGDFLYIFAGKGGTFEHMLVVNRVDADGRAFSVTNFNTPNGFIIDEILLYDPADPGVGIFPYWIARPNASTGSTGFGGFEVWRYRAP